MSSAFVILISLLVASQCDFISSCGIVEWNTAQYNWQEKCKKDYKGWPDGQRCFFLPSDAATNWKDSWPICAKQGATLASVLTSSEMHTIRGNFSSQVNLQTSMYRITKSNAESSPGTTCAYARNTTFFFANGNTTSSEKLSLNNTWIRNRDCEDLATNEDQCLIMWDYGKKFGDYYCSAAIKAVCQMSSPVQAFRRVDNVCVTETPLEIYDVAEGGLEMCMEKCRRYGEISGMGLNNGDWCRSFNLKGNKCELFTWWSEDKPSMMFAKDCEKDCVHYTYITNIA